MEVLIGIRVVGAVPAGRTSEETCEPIQAKRRNTRWFSWILARWSGIGPYRLLKYTEGYSGRARGVRDWLMRWWGITDGVHKKSGS